MKKMFLILFLLFLCVSTYADYKIMWMWKIDDPEVTWVRYKVDEGVEDVDAEWNYVPRMDDNPFSVVIDVEKDKHYFIRVQDSYDGVWWSGSSVSDVDTSIISLFEE